MFRKNDNDYYALRTDKGGIGIPTRGIMEKIIIEKVDQYENLKIRRILLQKNTIPEK